MRLRLLAGQITCGSLNLEHDEVFAGRLALEVVAQGIRQVVDQLAPRIAGVLFQRSMEQLLPERRIGLKASSQHARRRMVQNQRQGIRWTGLAPFGKVTLLTLETGLSTSFRRQCELSASSSFKCRELGRIPALASNDHLTELQRGTQQARVSPTPLLPGRVESLPFVIESAGITRPTT